MFRQLPNIWREAAERDFTIAVPKSPDAVLVSFYKTQQTSARKSSGGNAIDGVYPPSVPSSKSLNTLAFIVLASRFELF